MDDNKNDAVPIAEPVVSWGKGNILAVRDYEIVSIHKPLSAEERACAISQSVE